MAAWLAEFLSCCQPCCLTDCSWGLAQWQEVTPGACPGCRWALCLRFTTKRTLSVSPRGRQFQCSMTPAQRPCIREVPVASGNGCIQKQAGRTSSQELNSSVPQRRNCFWRDLHPHLRPHCCSCPRQPPALQRRATWGPTHLQWGLQMRVMRCCCRRLGPRWWQQQQQPPRRLPADCAGHWQAEPASCSSRHPSCLAWAAAAARLQQFGLPCQEARLPRLWGCQSQSACHLGGCCACGGQQRAPVAAGPCLCTVSASQRHPQPAACAAEQGSGQLKRCLRLPRCKW